ncbi:hypothetical protein K456DRAFT_1852814 [Colletotrichum gloeosporioides 23]|nr:hypothetical protein K456DRAFT_1852814 [Colletotrichum gloeosporioides 23]
MPYCYNYLLTSNLHSFMNFHLINFIFSTQVYKPQVPSYTQDDILQALNAVIHSIFIRRAAFA